MTDTKRLTLLEALEGSATAPTATHSVYLDGAAWSQSRDLRAKIREAKLAADGLVSAAPGLQAELDQVQEQIRASELVFTFTALPRTVYNELVDSHPSPDPALAWHPETFPPALVAAACVGISGVVEADGMTLEDVAGLYEKLNSAQTDELFRTAFQLQVEVPKPFTLPAGGATTGGGLNSSIATNTESPTANS
jgi:hypothetical protein